MTYQPTLKYCVFRLKEISSFDEASVVLIKHSEYDSEHDAIKWIDNTDDRYGKYVVLPVYTKP